VSPRRLVYIVVGVDIDAAHQLDEPASFRLAVTAHFINVLAAEVRDASLYGSWQFDTRYRKCLAQV